MRVVEANGSKGKIGVLVVPFPRNLSDALGLTLAVTKGARYFGYQAVLVANTDRVRAWVGTSKGLRLLWEKPALVVLGPYTSDPDSILNAGESALSGYVERWLSDLATHWRHAPGTAPAEKELAAEGIQIVADPSLAASS